MTEPGLEANAGLAAILRTTYRRAREHAILQWGAALAFYAAVSLAPLLLILLSVVGPVVGATELQFVLEGHARELLGPGGADLVRTILTEVRDRSELPRGLAFVALVGGATLFFAQLQTALHHIWGARPRRRHIGRLLRRRAKALGLTAILALLLAASIVASDVVRAAAGLLGARADKPLGLLISLGWIGSFVLFALLVAVLYKTLTEVRLAWRDVAVGVSTTTLLFMLGRWASGLYLVRAGVSSLYGAAASLIVLLFWLYYSAVSALIAAEFTAVWAAAHGRPLRPKRRARHSREP